MHKKDYLQRRLEEFGKVLALILTLKREQDWDKFEKEIASAAQKFTDLEMEATEKLSGEDFERQILNHPDLNLEQKKILASLLFEKLSASLEKNDGNAISLKNKCLRLYQHIYDNFTDNEFDLDVHYKLGFLNKL